MQKNFDEVKDSGKRQTFFTGSVRDTDSGKGQPHLIPGEAMNAIRYYQQTVVRTHYSDTHKLLIHLEQILYSLSEVKDKKENFFPDIYEAISLIEDYIRLGTGGYSIPYKRLAVHYSNGAKKYDKNNWRKGQFISRYYDSAMRHFWGILDKKNDEDHEAALYWNLIAIIQTKIDIEKGLLPKKLDDFPFLKENIFNG